MEAPAFISLMQSELLLCFNDSTFVDLFRVGPPYTDNDLHDVWCPSELKETGRHFTMDQPIFFDQSSSPKYELINKAEGAGRNAEGQLLKLLKEVDLKPKMEPGSSQKQGQGASSSSHRGIYFKDLRSGSAKVMPVRKFRMYVKSQDLICFNYAGYKMMYEDEDEDKSAQQSDSSLRVWLPNKKWDRMLETELVYVEKLDAKHSIILHQLETREEEAPQLEKGEGEKSTTEKEEVEEEKMEEQEDKIEGEAFEEIIEEQEGVKSWQDIKTKGYKATTKEFCASLDLTLRKVEMRLDRIDRKLDNDGRLLQDIQLSLSRTTERSSRQSFAQFYERLFPLAIIQPPITNKVLPYKPNPNVEKVGKLCSMPGRSGINMKPHPIPKFADIDILLKVRGGIIWSPEEGRVPTTTATEDLPSEGFLEIVIGEVTRSTGLCSSPVLFMCPTRLENSPSSKLLYKFVQLERDIIAAMDYYTIPIESIGGAAIISPSFMRLSKPRKLAAEVVKGFGAALLNVKRLHDKGRLWLVDI